MRITENSIMLAVPMLVIGALIAVLAMWAWGPIGGSAGSGPSSNATLVWNVEYWHRNAAGEVLQHKKDSNTIVASGLEYAMERLIAASATVDNLGFTNPAAGEIGEANAFDNIVLMGTDDAAAGGIASGNILLNVDGGGGNDTGRAAGGVENNPADGVYANVGSTTDGNGSVTLTFLADGNPNSAEQMHLTKADVDDTTAGGAANIAEADILATIEISVDLADTDTLTITWTIDLNL